MNKKFLQSVVVGISALTLATSCSSHSKIESNNCGAKNGCAAKKDEANKCSSKKTEETKEVTKAVKKTKKAKKAKVAKSTETTTENKTEEKSN
jgi:hypothetical protein